MTRHITKEEVIRELTDILARNGLKTFDTPNQKPYRSAIMSWVTCQAGQGKIDLYYYHYPNTVGISVSDFRKFPFSRYGYVARLLNEMNCAAPHGQWAASRQNLVVKYVDGIFLMDREFFTLLSAFLTRCLNTWKQQYPSLREIIEKWTSLGDPIQTLSRLDS